MYNTSKYIVTVLVSADLKSILPWLYHLFVCFELCAYIQVLTVPSRHDCHKIDLDVHTQ